MKQQLLQVLASYFQNSRYCRSIPFTDKRLQHHPQKQTQQDRHNKTTRIASARAEEVISGKKYKKDHNDLNQTSSTDLLKRQAAAAAVLSLFLRILVQESPYNPNTPQRFTLTIP
jgi:hypothetical protein